MDYLTSSSPDNHDSQINQPQGKAASQTANLTNRTQVLVVEDDTDIRNILVPFLVEEGFQVEATGSIQQTRSLLKNQSFDLALLDLRLSDGDGLELIPDLLSASESTAIILLTGFATLETAITALNQGAFLYLQKPVILDELLASIHSGLALQKARQEAFRLNEEASSHRERMQSANIRIKALMSLISNDLKSPLGLIHEASKLLQDELANQINPEQEKLLAIVSSETSRVLLQVSDLLELSSAERHSIQPKADPFDAVLFVKDNLAPFQAQFQNRRIQVLENFPLDLPALFADRLRAGQIIRNLLYQTLRIAPSGGTIELRIESKSEGVLFAIKGLLSSGLSGFSDPDQDAREQITLQLVQGIAQSIGGDVTLKKNGDGSFAFDFLLHSSQA